jgi:hypothetical protein
MRFGTYPGKTSHHLCIAAADRRRLGNYPKVLGHASLQLRTVRLTLDRMAAIDHKLDKLDEMGIGTLHDGDATRSDFTIETAEENVIEHKNGVLAKPSSRKSRNDEL